MLFAPVTFHATSGIFLDGSVNLMNEMRASGSALFAVGLLIVAGAFFRKLSFVSALVAAIVYLSYGLARLLSLAVDGMPDIALLQISAFEIVVGVICAVTLFVFRDTENAFS